VALRAQTALEDPKNAPKIFANTCSACHKSPAGLGRNGSASFLRQHYTTGPEMSAAMAAYLASAGSGPAPRKNDKDKERKEASAPNGKGPAKRDQVTATHPLTDGTTDSRPFPREKDKKGTKSTEPAKQATARPTEPAPVPAERGAQPNASTAALNTPAAPASPAEPPVVLDIPIPDLPTGPPADLVQPPAFSSAPLP
jgi:hypothetical protein